MKSLKNMLNGDWMKGAAFAAALCGVASAAVEARADVPILRRWANSSPTVDGVVAPGEWTYAQSTPLLHGKLMTMNDSHHLYVLIDVTDDTVNNPPAVSGPNTGDWFNLAFDVDLNHAPTPNVDLDYSSCNDGREFVKSIRLGLNSTTGCTTVNPESKGKVGFGPTLNSAVPHRFWEMQIDLNEIGVNPATWVLFPFGTPHVRFNVTTHSQAPAFDTHQPSPSLLPDMSNLFSLSLATSPVYPGGAGPVFMGVGLVPATYISADGYANINQPGYYYATNAPFGGDLRVFGRWSTYRYLLGASKYRVLVSKDGGPATRLRETWTNFKWNGLTWVPQAIGPDSNDAYDIPSIFELWYNPNQILGWHTQSKPDGTYRLSIELLNSWGAVLPSPSGNSLTLRIVNTPPSVALNKVQYDGHDICECGIVTQGSAPKGFSFDISVTDTNGALSSLWLYGTYGHGHSTDIIYSDSYTSGGVSMGIPFFVNHINADGPRQWDGISDLTVPLASREWRAGKSCAYSFILGASSRVQDGYGLLWSNVTDFQNLTILLGTGDGNTECPTDQIVIPIKPGILTGPVIDPIGPVIKPSILQTLPQ
jgi:hypothetical protein